MEHPVWPCTNWELGTMLCPSDKLGVAFLACPAEERQSDGLEGWHGKAACGCAYAHAHCRMQGTRGADRNGCIPAIEVGALAVAAIAVSASQHSVSHC